MENQDVILGKNSVEIVGIVKEQKLKEITYTKDGQEFEAISGSLVIACGEFKTVEIRLMVNKLTKKGTVNKTYEKLQGFIQGDYLTMVDNIEEATRVKIRGNGDFTPKLEENRFANKERTEVITAPSVSLGFGNITIDNTIPEEDFKAMVDVDVYIGSIEEEINNNDEETGRVIMQTYLPLYAKEGLDIMPLKVVAGVLPATETEDECDVAQAVRDYISEGDTVNMWIDINHERIVKKVAKGGGIGRAKIEDSTTYINEFVMIGGEPIDDVEKQFDEDFIRKALQERKIRLDSVLTDAITRDEVNATVNRGRGISARPNGRRPVNTNATNHDSATTNGTTRRGSFGF